MSNAFCFVVMLGFRMVLWATAPTRDFPANGILRAGNARPYINMSPTPKRRLRFPQAAFNAYAGKLALDGSGDFSSEVLVALLQALTLGEVGEGSDFDVAAQSLWRCQQRTS